MYNPFSLEGKTILITGASSGIGAQCAIDCSKMGAKVVLLARNEEHLQNIIKNCNGTYYSFDLNNLNGIKELVPQIVKENGPLDGFIHAAGIEKTLPIKNLKATDYESINRVNVLSAYEILKYITNKKYKRDTLRIVLIASITSVIGRIGTLAYSSSKGALVSGVKTLAAELAPKNININCVSPGTILTPLMQEFMASLTEEEREKRIQGFPLGLGKPEDISQACIFLLSDAARWITGQNIIVDGGYTAI